MTSPFPLCAGKQTKWEWSKSSGMLGWKSTSHTGMTYKNQNGNVHGMMPHPWGNRNRTHGKLLVTSPSFCKPTQVQFKLQGGVSPTKNAAASTYLGIVLVDEAGGKVVKQQEQHANTHTFKAYTWNLNNLNGKYHIELRDGKANSGWAHLELQSVIVASTSCGGSCTLKMSYRTA